MSLPIAEDPVTAEDDAASDGEAMPAPSAKGNYRLNAADWLQIVSMAKKGVPVGRIAKAFKVKPSSVYRGLRRRRVNIAATTAVAVEEHESAERQELLERIRQTKDRDYRHVDFLQGMVISTIAEAKRAKAPIATVHDDINVLKAAIAAVGNGTKIKWVILGLDRENKDADRELPELPIREMSDVEVEALRDRQILEDDNIDETGFGALDDDEDDIIEEGDVSAAKV